MRSALPLLRGSSVKTVVTIDGLDWNRPKWGRLASWMLRKSAAMAVKWADHLIIDNHPARKFFKDEYGASSSYVVYGADPVKPTSTEALGECGVEPKKYVLFGRRPGSGQGSGYADRSLSSPGESTTP